MKFGPDCRGECADCLTFYTGGCLAGHGDDEFVDVTPERMRKVLANPHVKEKGKERLRRRFPQWADNTQSDAKQ